eukprot:gnl/MRDRNA2_/MRDRNA2_31664_c0_seq1.p1 gnl/MRDRNA2_/MRDRNA2_31664_c0~~gnl/MRDRNA2_/MRDRNA2_31664_c0_seq1.p1  ORF type:complete len:568 (-),score=127.21 gnl/MRDRNA2_/MRDRNA2_31664_c0_seq1:7-1551(-)
MQAVNVALLRRGVITFLSVGPVSNRFDVLQSTLTSQGTENINFLVPVGLTDQQVPDLEKAQKAAEAVVAIAKTSPAKVKDVPSCFRVSITGNLNPGTPFFPGAYAATGAAPQFAIATENSDLLVQAFSQPEVKGNLGKAREALNTVLTESLEKVQRTAEALVKSWESDRSHSYHNFGNICGLPKVDYGGIDSSIASAVGSESSVVRAYEALELGPFGGASTLAISSVITGVIKKLPVKLCGYSGLMLPLCEDTGMAQRGSEGAISIQQLLHYSAVCGTGIDTIPIAGDTTSDRLAAVYCDMVAMAFRLGKPLSARLWPVNGKKIGDLTEVDNEFFVNSKLLAIDPPGVQPLPPQASVQQQEAQQLCVSLDLQTIAVWDSCLVEASHAEEVTPEIAMLAQQFGLSDSFIFVLSRNIQDASKSAGAQIVFRLKNDGPVALPDGCQMRLVAGGEGWGYEVGAPLATVTTGETCEVVFAVAPWQGCRQGFDDNGVAFACLHDPSCDRPFGPLLILMRR